MFHSPELSQQITKWGLHDAGFSYNIVAVFGSQSTGKSPFLFFIPFRHFPLPEVALIGDVVGAPTGQNHVGTRVCWLRPASRISTWTIYSFSYLCGVAGSDL